MEPDRPAPAHLGTGASLRAGLGAGTVCGLVFGLVDGVLAANLASPRPSAAALLGCVAAAVLQYCALWMAALSALCLLSHPFLRRRPVGSRYLLALRAGLAFGLFAELYWWTRPYVFYGKSSTSPERLLSTAAMFALTGALAWFLAVAIARASAGLKRAAALLTALAWLGGAVFLVFQAGALGSRGELNERNRDVPNVLLVIVDALRQDALGCYGNARVKTPSIDRLAAEGVVFENAFTQAPFTWPSFGSILTGKYPRRHGLLRMKPGVYMPPNRTLPLALKSATRSDGKELEGTDWVAATFHTGTLTESSGILYGFDLRYEATAGHDLVVLDSAWSVFRAYLLLSMLRDKVGQRLDVGGTAAEAQKFLAEHGADRRFFAMVHLYSTHTPYDPPEEFKRMYCDPSYPGPLKSFWADHRKLIEQGEYDATLADVEQIRNLYWAGVTQADAQIGELVAELERHGVLDETLVVVTADHGESLGERYGGESLWEHDHMVQTNLRIPLVMRWPKALAAKTRVAAMVDEIDIFPTVCDLMGLTVPLEDGEHGQIDGASLVSLVRGERTSLREFSFAENAHHVAVQDRSWKLVVPQAALLGDGGFAQALAGNERPRLYDLSGDAEERFNVVGKETAQAERLFAVLRDWNAKLPIPPDSVLESARDIENQRLQLSRFGYTESDESKPK